MTRHVYVDESKRGGYLLVASMHPIEELAEARSLMRGLDLKGQRRVHMTKESVPRRRVIVATLVGAGIRANVYDAGRRYAHELDARQACLRALVDDIAPHPDSMLILEQDDSLLDWDRRCLYAQTRAAGTTSLRYEHRRAATDQLLGHSRRHRVVLGQRRGLATAHRSGGRRGPRRLSTQNSARPGSPTVRMAAGLTSRRYCGGQIQCRTFVGSVQATPVRPRSRALGPTFFKQIRASDLAPCQLLVSLTEPTAVPAPGRQAGRADRIPRRHQTPRHPPGTAGVPPRAGPPRPPGQRRRGSGSPLTCGLCADSTRSSPR